MGIPIGEIFGAKRDGEIIKTVECEFCSHRYEYAVNRVVSKTGTSLLFADPDGAQERAAERADNALKAALASAVEPIPCPMCASFQRNMFSRVRKTYYQGLSNVAIASGLFGLGIFLVGVISTNCFDLQPIPDWCLWGTIVGLAGMGLVAGVRWILVINSDVNDEPPGERLERARKLNPDRAIGSSAEGYLLKSSICPVQSLSLNAAREQRRTMGFSDVMEDDEFLGFIRGIALMLIPIGILTYDQFFSPKPIGMQNPQVTIPVFAFLEILGIFLFLMASRSCRQKLRILQDGRLIDGVVVGQHGLSGVEFEYAYAIDNLTLKGNFRSMLRYKDGDPLIVAVSQKDPRHALVLSDYLLRHKPKPRSQPG